MIIIGNMYQLVKLNEMSAEDFGMDTEQFETLLVYEGETVEVKSEETDGYFNVVVEDDRFEITALSAYHLAAITPKFIPKEFK